MELLEGARKDYAWGSVESIPSLLGVPVTGEPFAEYWLGTHPMGPTRVAGTSLEQWVADDPSCLGDECRAAFGDRLPFLVKLLSAAKPLSLQTHPDTARAVQGFADEERAGVPLEASHRTFKDPWGKPEMLVGLTEFDALVGFRDPAATLELFRALGVEDRVAPLMGALGSRHGQAGLAQAFLGCLILDDDRRDIVTDVVVAAVDHTTDAGLVGDFARTAVLLDEHFPGDPSLLAALLLNRVRLAPGEAIHVPPGTMHAYLHGTGLEVLGNSDNTIRGGLTDKYMNPTLLVEVVDFTARPTPIIRPTQVSAGLWHYPVGEEVFSTWRMDVQPGRVIDTPATDSPRIIITTSGEVGISTGMDALMLPQGHAGFLPAGEHTKTSGNGTAYIVAGGFQMGDAIS